MSERSDLPTFSEHFAANAEGLINANVNSYSVADKTELRLDNLDRQLAVELAHGLTIRLDAVAATGRAYNKTNYLLANEQATAGRRFLNKEQTVFESAPALGNFVLQVALPDKAVMKKRGITKGKYSVIAKVAAEEGLKGTKTSEELGELLQKSYTSLMERVDLFPSKEQKIIDPNLKELEIPIPNDKEIIPDIGEVEEAATQAVKKSLDVLGVRYITRELLRELCEIKKWDQVTVIDLFMHVAAQKQKKGHKFPVIELKDMVQTTDKIQAGKLRQDQKSLTFQIYEQLGFKKADPNLDEPSEMEKRYKTYKRPGMPRPEKEKRKLRLRYAAWLASLPLMGNYRTEVKGILSEGGKLSTPALYRLATKHAYAEYLNHSRNRSDNYDFGIDWQKQDYEDDHAFLRTTVLLCLYVFYGRDISKIIEAE